MSEQCDRQSEFARLFEDHQRGLLLYMLSLVPHHADAVELLQETAAVLWQKFDQYDLSRPFGAWARGFAHMQAKKYRLYHHRRGNAVILHSEATLQALSKEYDEHEDVLELRTQALEWCIEKLTDDQRSLVRQRYWTKTKLKDVARSEGVPEHRLHRRLQQIRSMLQTCIDGRIAQGEV